MQKLSSETDIAIGFLHLGVEFFNYPTPDQVDLCRSLIKAGAKIIVCHHPHVPQGYETYRGGFITYGLGNFLFDMKPVNNTGSRIGVILRLSFEELEIRNVELVPIETANGFTSMLSRPLNQASEAFLTQLSKPLNDPAEISKHHYFTCRDNMMIHLKAFLFYGLLKKNLLKMKDLVRQQQWPQILEMRKSLFKYLVSGVAFKNESEKKVYPKSIESVVWRGICLFSGLLGRFFHVNTSSQQNLRR
jgi:hypothetical protein